jgi:hypothetical protein
MTLNTENVRSAGLDALSYRKYPITALTEISNAVVQPVSQSLY